MYLLYGPIYNESDVASPALVVLVFAVGFLRDEGAISMNSERLKLIRYLYTLYILK